MEWSNWGSLLLVALLVLCCGGMMIGIGRHRRHEAEKDREREPPCAK